MSGVTDSGLLQEPKVKASKEAARELAGTGYENVRDYVGDKDWVTADRQPKASASSANSTEP
jgi:hypothetical protein